MSESRRKTRKVYDAFVAVAAANGGAVRPGEVVAYLREQNDPFGSWEVRGELSNLEDMGLLVVDAPSGTWFLVEGADYEAVAAKGNGAASA